MEEFTHEFKQLSIYVDHQETDEEMAARYVNYLKFYIQDELSMHRVHNVEEAYKLSINSNEKQNGKFDQRNRGVKRGKSSTSHGGFDYGRGKSSQGDEKE